MGERHGMTGTPEYCVWSSMITRCSNPNQENYRHYGGRGINVCVEWRRSFAAFFAYVGKKP